MNLVLDYGSLAPVEEANVLSATRFCLADKNLIVFDVITTN